MTFDIRVGQGFDVHALVEGRPLIMGGVTIPYHLGLLGHSDADVLLHAITDAVLGAAGLGDIGRHFPDTDDKWKGARIAAYFCAVPWMASRLLAGALPISMPPSSARRPRSCRMPQPW